MTVAEILEAKRQKNSYVDYICKAYGGFSIPRLIAKIEQSKPVGCFNRHERDGFSYTECPMNEVDQDDGIINNLCSHQSDNAEVKQGSSRILHKHAIGLYRAGLYVLEEAGKIPIETGAIHRMLEHLALVTSIVDYPCELEYSRFTGRDIGKSLEHHDNGRDPVLRKTTSLQMLQQEVNEKKFEYAGQMNAIRNTIATALRLLLQTV